MYCYGGLGPKPQTLHSISVVHRTHLRQLVFAVGFRVWDLRVLVIVERVSGRSVRVRARGRNLHPEPKVLVSS